MNTTDDQSDTCAECGAPVTNEPHACSEAETTPPDDDSPRISIPANLWSTGLFKPAWSREDTPGEPQAVTPPKVITGSLLARPDDLPNPETPTDSDTSTGTDGVLDEVTGEVSDVTENTTAETTSVGPDGGSSEDFEPSAPAPASSSPRGGIDAAFVVPSSLFAAGDQSTEDEPDEEPTEQSTEAEGDELADDTAPAEPKDDELADDEPVDDEVEPTEPADDELADDELADDEPADAMTSLSDLMSDDADATGDESPDVAALTPPPLPPSQLTPPPLPPASTSTSKQPTSDAYESADVPTSKRSRTWIIALVIALLAAAAVGGWLWWQRGQDEPIRDAFIESNSAFIDASRALAEAESIDAVAAAGDDFDSVSGLLGETLELADGHNSTLSTSVRRATGDQIKVAQAAERLVDLSSDDFEVWGEVRGDLRSAITQLPAVKADISKAGGSTKGLPTTTLIASIDTVVGKAATSTATRGTARIVKDLNRAKTIKALRTTGQRASTGATTLTGAVESLADSEVDTAVLDAHLGVQNATAKLTRLRPNSLNQWEPIRAKIAVAARALPDGGRPVIDALASADAMVTEASATWEAWELLTEQTRTQKKDDVASVKAADVAIAEVLTEFDTLDSSLGDFLARGDSLQGEGREGEAFRTLDAAATARTELSSEVAALGTPAEVAGEIAAIRAALDASAASVRAAADAAAGCVEECKVTETPAWLAMAQAREGQASAVSKAVDEWNEARPAAIKQIRQRKLPKRPQI